MSRSTLKIRNWIWPVNRLYDLDYSLNLSVLLAPHDHKWSHSHADGHVEFNCHSFFFCVQLAGWASRCAVCALAPTGSNKFLFFGRSCKDPHRIFGHIGQDKRAIPLLFSLCWEYVANTNMICVYQKNSQSLRHLLQSAKSSSLVTYTCPFRLWLLLSYDHELRFTCTRI